MLFNFDIAIILLLAFISALDIHDWHPLCDLQEKAAEAAKALDRTPGRAHKLRMDEKGNLVFENKKATLNFITNGVWEAVQAAVVQSLHSEQ